MTKITHSKGGYLFGLILVPFFINNYLINYNFFYKLILILILLHFSYMGSLFPDIDMRGSYISKKYKKLYKYFGKKFKHRGFTHSIIYIYILTGLLRLIIEVTNNNIVFLCVGLGFIIGNVSHIFLDFITKEGVQLLYPLNINFSILPIKTSSKTEALINKLINFMIIFLIGFQFSVLI